MTNTLKRASLLNPDVSFTMELNWSRPTPLTTRRQVAKAAIGINTEFDVKSKKSSICMPIILTFASALYPRELRLPRTTIITTVSTAALFLLIFSSSWNVDVHVSAREMELVSAANSTSRKNAAPMMLDPPMSANTLGRVMNISDGPALRFSAVPPE